MHLFAYEVEYKRDYAIFHDTARGEVWADDWHEAVEEIQHHIFPQFQPMTVISILLLKEER